ncbi:MAG: hypothetical protein OYH77_05915 [Pseudomonadota bacterium]|nr:hypothetical protein [Pseudomonadota bacterium]
MIILRGLLLVSLFATGGVSFAGASDWLQLTVERKFIGKRVLVKESAASNVLISGTVVSINAKLASPTVDRFELVLDSVQFGDVYESYYGKDSRYRKSRPKLRVPLANLVALEKQHWPIAHLAASEPDPQNERRTAAGMLRAGYPHVILTVYDNGYLEVLVDGAAGIRHIIYVPIDSVLNGSDLRYAKGMFIRGL